jgi:hypothetical protein
MPNVTLNLAAFDRAVSDVPIADVFRALSGYYGRLAEQVAEVIAAKQRPKGVARDNPFLLRVDDTGTISQRLAKQFPLAQCEIARAACQSVVQQIEAAP